MPLFSEDEIKALLRHRRAQELEDDTPLNERLAMMLVWIALVALAVLIVAIVIRAWERWPRT
jgi:hypothetical protein